MVFPECVRLFLPKFCLLVFEEFLFNGFSEESLGFEHSVGLLDDICEVEM